MISTCPLTWQEEDEKRAEYCRLCSVAGMKVDFCIMVWANTWSEHSEGCMIARLSVGSPLTFEMLSKTSKLLGTRKIDVSCNLGCESDRTHDTEVTFWGARGL